jgi:ribonuclease BN (tRNA processing enzyme)
LGDVVLILDAGTGIRSLGLELNKTPRKIFILVSHLHFDHITGFPMFAPLYECEHEIYLLGHAFGGQSWYATDLLDGVHFPRVSADIPCNVATIEPGDFGMLADHGLEIEVLPVNHPGGALGIRVGCKGKRFVHVPDNELEERPKNGNSFERLVAFCDGVDVLSHDAQYLPSDYRRHEGWGHSLYSRTCELARLASVGHLVLFHHDPERTDDDLDVLQSDAAALTAPIQCTVAYEGLRLDLSA